MKFDFFAFIVMFFYEAKKKTFNCQLLQRERGREAPNAKHKSIKQKSPKHFKTNSKKKTLGTGVVRASRWALRPQLSVPTKKPSKLKSKSLSTPPSSLLPAFFSGQKKFDCFRKKVFSVVFVDFSFLFSLRAKIKKKFCGFFQFWLSFLLQAKEIQQKERNAEGTTKTMNKLFFFFKNWRNKKRERGGRPAF